MSKKDIERHGLTKHPLYKSWSRMISRCECKSYDHYDRYGGRGITVCGEWRSSFTAFYKWAIRNGYKSGLWIDRIDVDGNYNPDNCRWVTQKQSANNKSVNHFLEHDGEKFTIAEWAEKQGISSSTLKNRIERGWAVPDAILFPPFAPGMRYQNREGGRERGRAENVLSKYRQ